MARNPQALLDKLTTLRKSEVDDAERQIDKQLDEKFEGPPLEICFDGPMKSWIMQEILRIYGQDWHVDITGHGIDNDGCQWTKIKFKARDKRETAIIQTVQERLQRPRR